MFDNQTSPSTTPEYTAGNSIFRCRLRSARTNDRNIAVDTSSSQYSPSNFHDASVWIRRANPISDNSEITENKYLNNQLTTVLNLDRSIQYSIGDNSSDFHLDDHEILDTFLDMTINNESSVYERPKEIGSHIGKFFDLPIRFKVD
mmetsp:Transcript_36807/g.54067  ORF Transcript_36807/g.54067 Transcript_36807/m.54067 type:complete len:146 (+) Transcript_36807:103-540(+)|eukprot:CAMPEP_0195542042 /NCGR_PEP_ID=MMETSP0794_2-20130614/51402_1 /TAXON_ID=515487 /ORGANISM="Stephanopyxis turris, Strain CCMP 815" /LENGTH=145 /DNA_ID=CAMNT_0040676165 /DNA_START=97 /DNA_END=534 /DNA_ORIENTATION=+